MFSAGDWVGIKDCYRALDGADQTAFYGQIERVDDGDIVVYRVHCNNDAHHYFFADEPRLLPA